MGGRFKAGSRADQPSNGERLKLSADGHVGDDTSIASLLSEYEREYVDMDDEDMAEYGAGLPDIARSTSSPVMLDRIVRNDHLEMTVVADACGNPNMSADTLHAAANRVLGYTKTGTIAPNSMGEDSGALRAYRNIDAHTRLDERTHTVLDDAAEGFAARDITRQQKAQDFADESEAQDIANELQEWAAKSGRPLSEHDYDRMFEKRVDDFNSQMASGLGAEWPEQHLQETREDFRRIFKKVRALD